jgi:RHS repeat-associated protein
MFPAAYKAVIGCLIAIALVFGVLTTSAVASSCGWVNTAACAPASDSDPHGSGCDEYQCYCGPAYISSPTQQTYRCQQPGWLPSVGGHFCFPNGFIDSTNQLKCQCDVAITSFNSLSPQIHPGGSVSFGGTISDSSGAMGWTIALPNGQKISGTGNLPSAKWDGTDESGKPVGEGTYSATLTANAANGNCTATQTASVTVQADCNLQINKFDSEPATVDPTSGGTVSFKGDVSESSGNPISWTIVLPNGKIDSGTGSSPYASWDGTDAKGNPAEPNNYTAKLTVQTPDGQCHKSQEATVQVVWNNQCLLKVKVGSSANVASGALSQSQELFSTKGSTLPTAIILYYNSKDSHSGSLGTGWSHSYDLFLKQNADRSVVLHEGNGNRRFYTLARGSYVGQPGDFSSLVQNSDGSFTLTEKEGTRYYFSSAGNLSTITDRNDNSAILSYTGGNLATITDPAGRSTVFSYDSANHIVSIADSVGNSYNFSYSGNDLSSITYPGGGNWSYTYASNGQMGSKTDPLGNTTVYTYGTDNRLASATDPEGKTRSLVYPESGTGATRTTTFKEKDGGIWLYSYDTRAGVLLGKTDPEGGTTSYAYDANGNRTSTTLPDGTKSEYQYDNLGNMTSATDALGQTTEYTYNDFSQVVSVRGADGDVTGYSYDANGNMTAMTDPTGATTKYRVDGRGNVTSVTNAVGQTTSFSYDNKGNVISVTDPAGGTTTYTYDGAGNVTSQTDNAGNVTSFAYDSRNRLVKTIDPQGNITSYTYDLSGNKISQTDGNGNTTAYQYSYQGQPIRTIDALGNVTTFSYGSTGCPSCGGGTDKLTSLTDADGNSTNYNYDALGRLFSETDPLGNSTTYSYDPNGRVTAKTDGNGATTTYAYDSLGRLLKKSYPDGTPASFTYDSKGNIITAANQNISYSFVYDAKGDVTSVTDSNGKMVSYSYDAAGNRTKMVSPDGRTIGYSYDSAGRLKSISDNGTFSLGYDNVGRRSSLTYPNGDITTYSYDSGGRVVNIIQKNASGAVIASNSYTLDKVGNGLSNATQERSISYRYDPIYRLTQALSSAPGNSSNSTGKGGGISNAAQQQKELYKYDPVGNRLSSDHIASYAYNDANQLVQDGGSYTYDKNGNLAGKVTSDGKTTYTWDFENRLTKVTTPDGTVVTFAYDPLGRRIEKQGTGNGDTTTIHYFYDDENILFDYDDTGAVGNRYTHGPGGDEHLAVATGKDTYFYHADGLGSVTALTDSSGKAVQTYQYDSFGNLKDQKNRVKQPYTYTGREWDKETGLYLMGVRYYDPMEGRFLSKDPISFAGGDVNLYAYVKSNPINYRDPYGTNPIAGAIEGGEVGFAIGGPPGAAVGAVVGAIGGYIIADQLKNLIFKGPPGYRDAESGAAEWGKRHGVGAAEGKRRFHKGVKQQCNGSRAKEDYYVNPDTGDVKDSEGNSVGNLEDARAK